VTDANILILGETEREGGDCTKFTEIKRASEIFLTVDMGAINETLFESEMFGHVKGAFTDARRTGMAVRNGFRGTLFMDEIGNLSIAAQSKLLGVLQNLEITRLGSNKPIPVDFRLISATNKNPEDLVQQKLFREDLLFRINTIQIELPPLRERKEDIPGLADFFLTEYAQKYGKSSLGMTNTTYDALVSNHWAGNIRELKHTIEKAVILCDSTVLRPEDLNLKERNHER
jgi:transcriptional regulator with PAS, ATPase and Fis domain